MAHADLADGNDGRVLPLGEHGRYAAREVREHGETSPRAPAGDGAPLSTETTMLSESGGKNFSLDPGEHVVKVTSVRDDKAVIDHCRFTITQGTRVPIKIR